MIKSVAGQTIQSTQIYALKTVSPQPTVLEYSVKSYGERMEVAAELSFPWLLLLTVTNDQTQGPTQHFSAVIHPQNHLCAKDDAQSSLL